jgi:diaminopimelate decarboxylase
MRSSFRVAIGRAPPDRGWALGEAWRRTYRALVRVISHGGLKASSWQDFSRISREMERIACGPPAVNMGYMLALIDAGVMDLGHVSHDAGPSADARPGDVDIWIDATIPPPGQFDAAGPIGRLLDDGWLERGAGGGLVINQYGQALAGGRPVPGLSVLGRPTEGCVLGNDTLNRALHRHPFRWAERMIDRVAGVVDMQCRMLACS